MIKSNINQFIKETNEAIKKEQEKQRKKAKELVVGAYGLIIDGTTAVDTGLMKNSNFIEVNTNTAEVIDPQTRQQREQLARENKTKQKVPIIKFENGDRIRIFNNVKYALIIESLGTQRQERGLYRRVEQKIRNEINKS